MRDEHAMTGPHFPDGARVFVPGLGCGRVVHRDHSGRYAVDFAHLTHLALCDPHNMYDIGALGGRAACHFVTYGGRA